MSAQGTSGAGGALYRGRVMHRRLRPVSHRFSYRVFSMLIDLDRIDELAARLKLFSRNRFNVFSFHDRDFGPGREAGGPADIAAHMRGVLKQAGLPGDGRIELLFYPRMFGYAFNPLAVYYCYDAADRLAAIVYEVRNTFGGRHAYVIPAAEDGAGPVVRQAADKAFHVSPFMAMETRYHFRLTRPGEALALAIRQTDEDGALFHAGFSGRRRALDDRALAAAFFAYPLMTLKIIAGIHFEAARLLAKGLKLRRGARDPEKPVTVVRPGATAENRIIGRSALIAR